MKRKTLIPIVITILLLVLTGGILAQEQPTEISYMMWGSPEELAVWQTMVDEFEASHPDISVTVDVSDWDSYWNKLQTLFAGGTPPDVFAMDAPLYLDWQSRGVLLNLQPYLDATPGFLDDFYPVTLEVYQQDDGYYGLPRDFQTIVLYYNKDMFDAAGMEYPTDDWTLDDLKAAAKELTLDKDGDGITDQWGFATDLWDMELFWSEAIWSYGGSILSDDHMQTLINEDGARDAWDFIAGMMVEDKSLPDPYQAEQFGGDPFAAGVAAMTTIGHWVVPEYSVLNFSWDVAAFPAGPVARATSVNSAGLVIANASQNPDAAWEFVKYADGVAGQTQLTELGFSIPVLQSLSQTFVDQDTAPIRQQVFVDALDYAHVKPVFRGYDEWASVIGDGLLPVWTGEMSLDDAMADIIPQADDVLAMNAQ